MPVPLSLISVLNSRSSVGPILDSFENWPNGTFGKAPENWTLDVYDDAFFDRASSRSTSHVTDGSYSWQMMMDTDGVSQNATLRATRSVDLSLYSTLKLDFYVAQNSGSLTAELRDYINGIILIDFTSYSTGVQKNDVTVDISGADGSELSFFLDVFNDVIEIFVDNLRLEP